MSVPRKHKAGSISRFPAAWRRERKIDLTFEENNTG